MKTSATLVAALLLAANAASGAEAEGLDALARADYAHAVRPGGVDGAPFWNVYARMFMYPPAFDFSKGGPGTVKYRFTVLDAAGRTHAFDAPSSQSPLTPVWNDLAPGQAWVYVSAVDKDGGVHGIPDWPRDRFSRTFWRSAPFRPGAYPPAPRSYAEAVAKCGDEVFERPATQHFLKTGKPDPAYKHNCYPSKMHAALIDGMLGYAAARSDRAAEALKLARNAADFLISISQPAGAPLEYWPPTYADRREAGSFRFGQIMLIYPCRVGESYLALHDRVKDAKYLTAAKRIADTYVKLQEKDGTWPIFMRESDGKVLNDNRVQPVGVITFLEALYKACGEAKYRACADRAFAWVEAHPLKDWFWEGQFEDAPFVQKYENPSKHPACEAALYLLKRFPGDRRWLAVARDLVRYAEDQFVCWEKPCAANGHGVNTPIGDPSAQQNRYGDWFFPCALEQYVYYVPVDASNAKMIRTYLALYRAEGNPLDLAKAKALGDALVRTQQANGYIPTEYAKVENRDNPMQGWLNCTCASIAALAELAAADAAPKTEPAARPRLAFQVYGVRDLCEKDFAGTLKAVRALGYEGVETGRFYGRSAAELKRLCAEAGLELVALQLYPETLAEPKLRETIRFCREAGCRRINTAWYKGSAENPMDWQLVVNVINHAAEVCAAEGITVAYHNHDQEFATAFAGRPVAAWLHALGRGGPDSCCERAPFAGFSPLVKQEFDAGWCSAAGGDPVKWLKEHPGLNPTVHVMPGYGTDWPAVVKELKAQKVEWLVAKPTARPDSLEDLKNLRPYLEGLLK